MEVIWKDLAEAFKKVKYVWLLIITVHFMEQNRWVMVVGDPFWSDKGTGWYQWQGATVHLKNTLGAEKFCHSWLQHVNTFSASVWLVCLSF